MPYVIESLILENKVTLTALVYPDFEQAEQDGLFKVIWKQNGRKQKWL